MLSSRLDELVLQHTRLVFPTRRRGFLPSPWECFVFCFQTEARWHCGFHCSEVAEGSIPFQGLSSFARVGSLLVLLFPRAVRSYVNQADGSLSGGPGWNPPSGSHSWNRLQQTDRNCFVFSFTISLSSAVKCHLRLVSMSLTWLARWLRPGLFSRCWFTELGKFGAAAASRKTVKECLGRGWRSIVKHQFLPDGTSTLWPFRKLLLFPYI